MLTSPEFKNNINNLVENKKFDEFIDYLTKTINKPDYQTQKIIDIFINEWTNLKKAPALKIMDEKQIKVSFSFFLRDNLYKLFNQITEEKFQEIHFFEVPIKEIFPQNEIFSYYETYEKVNIFRRWGSIAIDRLIYGTYLGLISFPYYQYLKKNDFSVEDHKSLTYQILLFLPMIIYYGIYLNKDIYKGQGFGKYLMKLQIIDRKTKKTASPIKCVLRNLLLILYPVEFIITLFNPRRRLGDYIFGTEVVNYRKENVIQYPKKQIITSLIIAILFTFTITLLFYILFINFLNVY